MSILCALPLIDFVPVEVILDVTDDVTSDDTGVVAVSDKEDVGVGVSDVEIVKEEADEVCVLIGAEEGESDIDCGAEVDS